MISFFDELFSASAKRNIIVETERFISYKEISVAKYNNNHQLINRRGNILIMSTTNDVSSKLVSVGALKKVYTQIVNEIEKKVEVTFKSAGSCKFADLPTPSKDVLGNVYNIEDDFVTTDSFVEGKGLVCTKGADIAIISVTDSDTEETVYRYDLLNASADLQRYVTQSQIANFSTEMANYIKEINFQKDGTNVIEVVKGNGSTSSYTINVGSNADVVTTVTVTPEFTSSLGSTTERHIVKDTENKKVTLRWRDPEDTGTNDSWAETIILGKKGSFPTSYEDGRIFYACAVKNMHRINAYEISPEIEKFSDISDPTEWYFIAIPVATTGYLSKDALSNKFDFWHYGFCIDENNPAEAISVTYLKGYDNENYKPLKVIFNTNDPSASELDWGSWKDAPFMPRPCMLKYDGTVDYYLDPDDYTLKEDRETASDVANTSYEGNAMMEWSPIYRKVERITTEASEDGSTAATSKLYMYFCSDKFDDDYECWSAKKEDGTYGEHFYTSIYEGTIIDSRLRSMSTGKLPSVCLDGLAAVIIYAANNGVSDKDYRYCCDVWSDHDLIMTLGILVTRRLNIQKAIGFGCTSYGVCGSGTSNKKGMFFGTLSAQNNYATKFFGMENRWGHLWHYCAGIILPDAKTIYVKNTYSTIDGSTEVGYNTTSSGYINTNVDIPTSSGYIKTIWGDNRFAIAPKATGGSSSTYYSDCEYCGSSGLLVGHDGNENSPYCGMFSWNSSNSPLCNSQTVGTTLSFKAF